MSWPRRSVTRRLTRGRFAAAILLVETAVARTSGKLPLNPVLLYVK